MVSSKLRGGAKAHAYPQPEGTLGEAMVKFGKDLGEETCFGMFTLSHFLWNILPYFYWNKTCLVFAYAARYFIFHSILIVLFIAGSSLIECGEALKQMAEIKYALEDNVKQNFLEPLHHLQTKDLKDVMVK